MTDQPRKTLTMKRTSPPTPEHDKITGTGSGEIVRSRKRIIRRDELPTTGLAKPKAKAPPKKPAKQKKPAGKPKPIKSPSDLRAEELDASLNGFPVWLNRQPLAHGSEREIFQHVARLHLSASKRVVLKLLRLHTHNRRYLDAVQAGRLRYRLDGTPDGGILPEEREHAGRVLAGLTA